jgi:hypothetical protein
LAELSIDLQGDQVDLQGDQYDNAARPNRGASFTERINLCRGLTAACARRVACPDRRFVAHEACRPHRLLQRCSLHKRDGAWRASSASTDDKPFPALRCGPRARRHAYAEHPPGGASAPLTTRGRWFARTAVTEMAEKAGPRPRMPAGSAPRSISHAVRVGMPKRRAAPVGEAPRDLIEDRGVSVSSAFYRPRGSDVMSPPDLYGPRSGRSLTCAASNANW